MTVLALDIAIKTGWADATTSGVQDFTQYADDLPRLFHEFHMWVYGKLTRYDELIMEAAFVSSKFGSQTLVVINGIAKMAAHENDIYGSSFLEVAPAKWRKEIFGQGDFKRKQAKARAIAHACALGRPTNDDNEAEAICILEYHSLIQRKHNEKKAARVFALPGV